MLLVQCEYYCFALQNLHQLSAVLRMNSSALVVSVYMKATSAMEHHSAEMVLMNSTAVSYFLTYRSLLGLVYILKVHEFEC